ncbi:chryseobasin-related MNIO class RiPP peptide [Dyadobacter luticola]|uniref:chryseobasin-related MNIO class RiPP peptide n=1 Tax=Dyadobacter luticola TaxID=1979387 RepID=UPI0026CC2E23
MKISKSVLQSVAVAVALTTLVSTTACVDNIIKPNSEKKLRQKVDPCPGCGMG